MSSHFINIFPLFTLGIDTPVTVRLNSGTNVLPKGLKCFIKIAPVMPPVQSALFHHHHHQSDHLYHPHPHPQLNSSVTDLKSMSTTVPPPPQNTLPNYDSRLLTVTLHAPKKSASEVSSETKSDVGDDDDDQNDDSLLYFHLDRQIEPFGTYELTLVLKSAYSRAQVCSINQWAVSSSASSALNFFSGPSSAASLNLNSKPSSNSRDYQLTVSWTASQVSASDQQTSSSSSSSVSTSTSMTMMMMMAANCTFTLYAPFHLFTKLHSVGGAGRKLLEVGLLGATDLINSGGRAVVVRRPKLSHHAQHQKMMAKLAVTTLNVAQSDHHVDLGPLGPLPSKSAGKGVTSNVSSINFKPIHSGRSQQNSTYPLKANTEQHFLWEFESDGENDHRTAPLSLANLKRFNLELSFAEAPKSDDDKVPNWKAATFEVRLSTDLSTRYTVREHIEPMAAHHHFSSAALINNTNQSHNANTNSKNMSTELLRVGSSCLLRVTIEKVVVVKTTDQSGTTADDLEDNNSAEEEEEEEEEEDDEQIMYELVYDADLWSMVVNSSTNSGGGGGGGSHPPPYPQQPNHPLHHHHPHLKHRRNLSSTETTGTLSSLASSTGSAAQPESLGSLSSMTTLTSTNTNTNFSSGYYSLQGSAPCSEQQNKFTSLQQESTTTTANSLISSSAAVAAAFNVHSKVLRLSSAEPTFEALFEMTPLADGYLPYPSVRLSRYVEQGKSSGPGGGERDARWQTPNFAPRSASPTPKGGSVESVIHGGGGGSSGSNGSGDNLDGTGASKSGTAAVEPLTTTSSGPLSLSVKNWTAKLLSSSSSLTPSKSSSSHHHQYQSLSTGAAKASSTEQLHQIGNDHHQAGVSSKPTPISGKLIAFEPGQVYNYSRAAQIYVLPAAIAGAAVESSASDSAHSTTMTTQTAHTSSSSSSSSAAAAAALSGPMTAVSVASG